MTDFKFTWLDAEYSIPANRVPGAVEQVERFMTLEKMIKLGERGAYSLVNTVQAFGALMRYARVPISDDDIHEQMFRQGDLTENFTGMLKTFVALYGHGLPGTKAVLEWMDA